MQTLRKTIYPLIVAGGLFLLFGLEALPENNQFREFLNSASASDIIIIFNSGGWGNTPLEEADDFLPIINGIEKTLNDWGLNTIVIPYERTKNGFLGKITGAKEAAKSSPEASKRLAKEIEVFLEENPGKKIIMTGLSNGAAFVDKTIKQLDEFSNSVLAVEVGVPFWHQISEEKNVLLLDNGDKDSLAEGKLSLFFSLFKTPLKWLSSRINGQNLIFSRAFQVAGHDYSWDSSEVGPEIVSFLKNTIR